MTFATRSSGAFAPIAIPEFVSLSAISALFNG